MPLSDLSASRRRVDATRSRNHIITFIIGASLFVVGSPCFPFGAHAPSVSQFVSAPIFLLEISLCVFLRLYLYRW